MSREPLRRLVASTVIAYIARFSTRRRRRQGLLLLIYQHRYHYHDHYRASACYFSMMRGSFLYRFTFFNSAKCNTIYGYTIYGHHNYIIISALFINHRCVQKRYNWDSFLLLKVRHIFERAQWHQPTITTIHYFVLTVFPGFRAIIDDTIFSTDSVVVTNNFIARILELYSDLSYFNSFYFLGAGGDIRHIANCNYLPLTTIL